MNKFKIFILIFSFSFVLFENLFAAKEVDIYKKIDLFSEVLEKINKEYVEEIDQSEAMDSLQLMVCFNL